MRRVAVQGLTAAVICLMIARGSLGWKRPDIRVDDNGPADFHTIQAAIDAASEGEGIVVTEGFYPENIRIEGKNVRLRSRDPNDPNVVAATIIDGGFAGAVVTFSGTESGACLLRGFTLQHGSAPQGGGICGNGTSATIRGNIIRDNVALGPGGLDREDILSGDVTASPCGDGGGLFACDGLIEHNTIAHNTSVRGGGLSFCMGTISDNIISANTATLHGGGLDCCDGVISDNAISENIASFGSGGGLRQCDAWIEGNLISHNVSRTGGGGLFDCDGPIHHNVIAGNDVTWGNGGGLEGCDGGVENNTIVGNRASEAGGGLGNCTGKVFNCIIWENRPSQLSTVPQISYCDVQGGSPTNGNVDVDPGFAPSGYWDPNATPDDLGDDVWVDGDYRLPSQAWRYDPVDQTWSRDETTSPCIDKGDPYTSLGAERFPHGGRINLGAYGGTAQAALSYYGEQGYAGGSGTEADPFILCIPQHLVTLTGSPDQWDKVFRLHNDIDVTDWPNMIGPIGNSDDRFGGTFDGNEKTIIGLTLSSSQQTNVGLFGRLWEARIARLRLTAPLVDAPQTQNVGALAGSVGRSEVSDCHVEQAIVSGRGNVGGLVGSNGDWVNRCSFTGEVVARLCVGGIAGFSQGLISESVSKARIEATTPFPRYGQAGGIVGNNAGTVRDCYVAGKVLAPCWIGGLAGINQGSIGYCYSTAIVLGREEIGGLVGHCEGGIVHLSYWDKQTSGRWVSAGGEAKTTAQLRSAATFAGWPETAPWTLAEGADYPRLAWENAGGQPLAGPDPLASLAGAGTPEDPYLIHTAEELNRVAAFPSRWDRHFRLTADIDLEPFTAAGVITLGTEMVPFSGTFDGAGHSVSGLNYDDEMSMYLGLFGIVNGPEAAIRNVTVVDPTIKGYSCVAALVGDFQQGLVANCVVENASITAIGGGGGGLVGHNAGVISQCAVRGTVTTEAGGVGVLAGGNDGIITQCQASGTARGTGASTQSMTYLSTQFAGGLVGYNMGHIDNCFARSSVYAEYGAGGLVGRNRKGSIAYCYCSGPVAGSYYLGGFCASNDGGTITSCFWDAKRCECTVSDGGVGKTIVELKQAATFLDAGWDFVGETANGTDDIWTIAEGLDYPKFA